MNRVDGDYVLDQKHVLMPPKTINALTVPQSRWEAIKTKLTEIEGDPWVYQTLSSSSLGAGLAALVTPLLTNVTGSALTLSLVIGFAFLALAGAFFCVVRQQTASRKYRIAEVLDIMTAVEENFETTVKGGDFEKSLKNSLSNWMTAPATPATVARPPLPRRPPKV